MVHLWFLKDGEWVYVSVMSREQLMMFLDYGQSGDQLFVMAA